MRINVVLLLWCLAMAACVSKTSVLHIDPMVVRVGKDADLPSGTYHADTLLYYAQKAEVGQEIAKAQRLYSRLMIEFPNSYLRRTAMFGWGRTNEAINGCRVAARIYQDITMEEVTGGEKTDWVDAHFRAASCFVELATPNEAIVLMNRLLLQSWLTPIDKLDAKVSRGIAYERSEKWEQAESDLLLVLGENDAKEIEFNKDPARRFVVAKATYHLGEINRHYFDSVKLEFPQNILEQRLEEKSQHLLRAQNYYVRAIRLGDLQTAAAAGYQIGALYENFHQQIVALNPPADLTVEQTDLYRNEVRNKVSILLQKAVKVYEEAIAMARRTGLDSEWIDRTSEAVERIKKTYFVETPG